MRLRMQSCCYGEMRGEGFWWEDWFDVISLDACLDDLLKVRHGVSGMFDFGQVVPAETIEADHQDEGVCEVRVGERQEEEEQARGEVGGRHDGSRCGLMSYILNRRLC